MSTKRVHILGVDGPNDPPFFLSLGLYGPNSALSDAGARPLTGLLESCVPCLVPKARAVRQVLWSHLSNNPKVFLECYITGMSKDQTVRRSQHQSSLCTQWCDVLLDGQDSVLSI